MPSLSVKFPRGVVWYDTTGIGNWVLGIGIEISPLPDMVRYRGMYCVDIHGCKYIWVQICIGTT